MNKKLRNIITHKKLLKIHTRNFTPATMMIRSVPLAPSMTTTICCSSRNNAYIPKLEPFSRSKFDRIVKDPPLIQKSENDLAGTLF